MLSPLLDFSLNLNRKSIWNLAWPHIIIVCQVAERIVETFFVFYYKEKNDTGMNGLSKIDNYLM